jgi:hypothetical protein
VYFLKQFGAHLFSKKNNNNKKIKNKIKQFGAKKKKH